jgi:hypothetical protein
MRAEIIRFPKSKRKRAQPTKSHRCVFYTGHRYVGPAFCQDVQQVYLNRHGNEEWSLIFYFQGRSWELDRFAAWFDQKFDKEVTQNLVDEKIMKRFLGMGEPSSQAIRAGSANIRTHLDYIAYLTEERRWLAGNDFSLADITAAAHLSSIDYLGDVPWSDHIPGCPPPKALRRFGFLNSGGIMHYESYHHTP